MHATAVTRQTLFQAGQNGYASYRIPTLIALADDRVIAFCEGRVHSAGDAGHIDILARVSDDGGRTFAPQRVVVSGNGGTAGNPCPVYDAVTRTLLLVFTRNDADAHEGRVLLGEARRTGHVVQSTDGGNSWSDEVDITAQIVEPAWTWLAFGPCHAIQLSSGRLVVPCNHGLKKQSSQERARYLSHTVYSDDHGQTWQSGMAVSEDTNECAVAELEDGRLLINMRSYAGQHCRAQAWSGDGGQTFSDYALMHGQQDPVCQGSLLGLRIAGQAHLLLSHLYSAQARENLVLRHSADGGHSWDMLLTVEKGRVGYSDMAPWGTGGICMLYEAGDVSFCDRIVFEQIQLSS